MTTAAITLPTHDDLFFGLQLRPPTNWTQIRTKISNTWPIKSLSTVPTYKLGRARYPPRPAVPPSARCGRLWPGRLEVWDEQRSWCILIIIAILSPLTLGDSRRELFDAPSLIQSPVESDAAGSSSRCRLINRESSVRASPPVTCW